MADTLALGASEVTHKSSNLFKGTMFTLTEEQIRKLNEWEKTLPDEPPTAIGGRLEFSFIPTSIGTFITVKDCISKKELDLSDL